MNPYDWIVAVLALTLLMVIARSIWLRWRYVGGVSPNGGSDWTVAYYVIVALIMGALIAGGHGQELVDSLLGRD